ncbi:MAG: thioredoxin [Lachnospiraceae bacterium]|nr:thioredoxin [Lachnospiraceae bacterium]
MAALHITKENFEAEVMKSEKPVLVDFWASWCGPCQMVAPVIEELSQEVTDVKIAKINVDEEPELAAQFRVMNIPTLILLKEGKVAAKVVGAQDKDELLDMIHA